jgi:oxygen-independent coproporphyrinogen-3 oxidase
VPYAGLGPSAHEFDGARRRWNASAYVEWVRRLMEGRDPIESSEELTDENRVAEDVYLSLRTLSGLTVRGPEIARVAPWIDSGWARWIGENRLALTPLGWLRLDALAADLTLVRSRY